MKETITQTDDWQPEDITEELQATDPELLRYMRLLPKELWSKHFHALEKISKTHADEESEAVRELRINYILGILQSREKAIETFDSLDPALKDIDAHVWGEQLQSLLVERGNLLGSGMTARVKSLSLLGRKNPIAVKYLLTPTAKTLSVEGEYDIESEVELVTTIEDHEKQVGTGKHVSLPHPLFYYKRGSLQCYGMEQINGATLEELANETSTHLIRKDRVLRAVGDRYATEEKQKELYEEADAFVKAMHEVCLHGDIKLGNMMADEDGRVYIIDFGQAVRINDMTEDSLEQYENLQEMERDQVRVSIQRLLQLGANGRIPLAA